MWCACGGTLRFCNQSVGALRPPHPQSLRAMFLCDTLPQSWCKRKQYKIAYHRRRGAYLSTNRARGQLLKPLRHAPLCEVVPARLICKGYTSYGLPFDVRIPVLLYGYPRRMSLRTVPMFGFGTIGLKQKGTGFIPFLFRLFQGTTIRTACCPPSFYAFNRVRSWTAYHATGWFSS